MAKPDPTLEELFASNEAVFNWCLRSADRAFKRRQFEAAAEWCSLAGHSAAFNGWFGCLSSPALESLLLRLGAQLPSFSKRLSPSGRRRWLHVMTTAYEIGGHTNLVLRWMQNDKENGCHSVLITDQNVPFPEKLRSSAKLTGGQVVLLDRKKGHMARAMELRKYASEAADIVVLHIHPHDAAAVVAFAAASDVPVCIMNHMDHLFWMGAGVADAVIEFRSLGKLWSEKYRGINRSLVLPIPLEPPKNLDLNGSGRSRREAAKRRLGIPPQAEVLLTVATPYKYQPVGGWNFLSAAHKILKCCPDSMVLAVGPSPSDLNKMWGRDQWQFNGRFRAVGCQKDLADYYAAADVALGSYPFASQTALLECALHTMPCVPTPAGIPFGFDDPAFEGLPAPITQEDYVAEAIRLVSSPQLRAPLGTRLATEVEAHHCGGGWMAYLNRLGSAIPAGHNLYGQITSRRLDRETCEFWAEFAKLREDSALRHVHGRIIANCTNVVPRHDMEIRNALKNGHADLKFPTLSFAFRNARYRVGGFRRRIFSKKSNEIGVL